MRVASIVCVTILIFTSGASAQPDRIDSFVTPPAMSLTDFWTERQQQDAQPIPLPVIEPSELGPGSRAEPPSAALPPDVSTILPGDIARMSGDVRSKPLIWAGKLFTRINENTVGFCSAQLVAPDVVVTAAHCIRDNQTGAWTQQTIFRQQFERGKGRIFTSECTAAYNSWVTTQVTRYQWDYAMIKLRGSSDQGYFGLEYGWRGKYNRAPKIGYPSAIEEGQVIQVDFGPVIQGWAPYVIGLNHRNPNNTKGSSGGAWVGAYDPNATNPSSNVVISVTSHSRGEDKGTSYGPYWDQRMLALLDHAKRGCR